jgi:hypothetical protein
MKKMYSQKILSILFLSMFVFVLTAYTAEGKKDTTVAQPKILPEGYMPPFVNDSTISYIYTEDYDSVPSSKREYYQDDKLRDTLVYLYRYDTLQNGWAKSEKRVMKYNYNDVVTEQKIYEWNEVLQQWINQEYTRRTENTKLEVEARYTWNPIVEQWIGDRLDSAILDDGIVKFSYNSYSVDQNNNWIISTKRENEHFYYLDSTKAIVDYFIYQSDDQTYRHYTRTINVLDKDGQLIYRERYRDEDDVLQPESRNQYYYNNNGQRVLTEEYEYNFNDEVWELREYREYEYSFNGKNIHRETHRWDQSSGSVIPYSKSERTYSGEKLTQILSYSWNQESDNWEPTIKQNYSYDVNDNIVEGKVSKWDANNLEWVLDSRTVREYDDEGNRILEAEFETGIVDGQQETEVERREYEYDIDGEILLYYSSKTYRWDDDLQKLIGTTGLISKTSASGLVRQSISLRFDTASNEWYPWVGSHTYKSGSPSNEDMDSDTIYVTDTVYYQPDTVFISDTDTDTIFVSDTVFIADTVFIPDTTNKLTNVAFEEEINRKVQLYPNPANDYINVQLPLSEGRLEIWSMEGRKMFEQPIIQAQQQINIQHLKPGMYAVIIQQQNKSPLKFNLIKQ